MSIVDLFTAASFFIAICSGAMYFTFQGMRKKLPEGRIRTRMQESFVVKVSTTKEFDSNLFTVKKATT